MISPSILQITYLTAFVCGKDGAMPRITSRGHGWQVLRVRSRRGLHGLLVILTE